MSTKKPAAAQRAAAEWRVAHPDLASGVPAHLYTDENPACTIKGTGFRDLEAAARTIELTSQPGVRFKQHWTIMAMRERAAHHPNQTAGMREAIGLFDQWLADYNPPDPAVVRKELQEYRARRSSAVNQHSYQPGCDKHEERQIRLAQQDIARGQRQLVAGIKAAVGTPKLCASVECDLPAITAVFGGPGIHGYGMHTVDNGEHVVQVESESQIVSIVGSSRKKLPLSVPVKLRCCYNETVNMCDVKVSMSRGFKSIEQFWSSAKRAKADHIQDQKSALGGPDKCAGWACAMCTFRHEGSMSDFLMCHMCGSSRNQAE